MFMSKKRRARPKLKSSNGTPEPPRDAETMAFAAFGMHPEAMTCRIVPDPEGHGDREITGTMSDSQLGSGIRRLCAQGFVILLWNCHGRMYLRAIPPESDVVGSVMP